MTTHEDVVLEAATDAGWSWKRLRSVSFVYRVYEFRRGGRKVVAQFDEVDADLVDAFTSRRDFGTRRELIDYLREE